MQQPSIEQSVSKATAELDPLLEAWRTCPLGEIRYLFLDARYEKVRVDGQVVNMAVLIAQACQHRNEMGSYSIYENQEYEVKNRI